MVALLLALAAPVHAQIYVANSGNSEIVKYTGPGSGTTFATGLSSPQGVAVDSTGNVYTTSGNTIVKFTPGGSSSVFASTNLSNPWGLAFDSSGNLYAANYNQGSISEFGPGGNFITTFASGKAYVNGLAFDSTGHLYVSATDASAANPAIIKFTGTSPSTFATSTYLSDPKGLAFDASGNLYVANSQGSTSNYGTIYRFDTGANATLFADPADGLHNPYGLAFANNGGLLVSNYAGGNILAFDPSGNPSSFATGLNHPIGIGGSAIPEPSTYAALTGLAALALAVWRRRKTT